MNAFQSLFSELPSISMEYVRTLLDQAEARNLDSAAILSAGAVAPQKLGHPHNRVSINQFLDMLHATDMASADENWALECGRALGLSEHSLVAMPLICGDDAMTLADNGLSMISLRLPLFRLKASKLDADLRVVLEPLWDHHDGMVRALDIIIGTLDRFISQLSKDYTISLGPHQARDAGRLANALHQQVRCDEKELALQIHGFADGNFLPGPLRDPGNRAALSANVQQTLLLIRRYIMCDPGRACTPERVAERIGTTTRTLNRYLSSAGQSFSKLRNEVRTARGKHFLRHSSMPIIEIADRLGYSDQASFSKAFRNWTGQTPGDYRRTSRLSTPEKPDSPSPTDSAPRDSAAAG